MQKLIGQQQDEIAELRAKLDQCQKHDAVMVDSNQGLHNLLRVADARLEAAEKAIAFEKDVNEAMARQWRSAVEDKDAFRPYAAMFPKMLEALRQWDRFAQECRQRNIVVPLWAATINEKAALATKDVFAQAEALERGTPE